MNDARLHLFTLNYAVVDDMEKLKKMLAILMPAYYLRVNAKSASKIESSLHCIGLVQRDFVYANNAQSTGVWVETL